MGHPYRQRHQTPDKPAKKKTYKATDVIVKVTAKTTTKDSTKQ